MSTEDTVAIVNQDRLRDSAGGDPALVAELVSLFLAEGEAKLPTLFEAAEGADLHRMSRLAHGLKGCAAALGCEEAARAFGVLEVKGRMGETADLEVAVREAEGAWGRASEQLRGLAA